MASKKIAFSCHYGCWNEFGYGFHGGIIKVRLSLRLLLSLLAHQARAYSQVSVA